MPEWHTHALVSYVLPPGYHLLAGPTIPGMITWDGKGTFGPAMPWSRETTQALLTSAEAQHLAAVGVSDPGEMHGENCCCHTLVMGRGLRLAGPEAQGLAGQRKSEHRPCNLGAAQTSNHNHWPVPANQHSMKGRCDLWTGAMRASVRNALYRGTSGRACVGSAAPVGLLLTIGPVCRDWNRRASKLD